jgi:hypothetical protein
MPSLDTEGSDGPVELALAYKPLKVGIPEDAKKVDWLRANLEKMGCAGLLDVSWHHEEPAWLQEIWKRDQSAFPNTVRADQGYGGKTCLVRSLASTEMEWPCLTR